MDYFRIERAIALVDPMGLLKIGAPLDEYSSESHAIWSMLPASFSRSDFFKVYNKVMKESFGGVSCKLSPRDAECMFRLIVDEVDALMKFYRGDIYQVTRNEHVSACVYIYEIPLRAGDFLTVLDRRERSNRVELSFLLNSQVVCKNMDTGEEARMRWFFEEVR